MSEAITKVYNEVVLKSLDTNINTYQDFLKRETIPKYVKTIYPPDRESQIILNIKDFETGYLYRAFKQDMNIVVVMGVQGRGKTNLLQYVIKFCKTLGVPFNWNRNRFSG